MISNNVFHIYKINSPKSFTKYVITRIDGELKIDSKNKESFNSLGDLTERVLNLEEEGYRSISMLEGTLDKEQLINLFGEKKPIKGLRLSFNGIRIF